MANTHSQLAMEMSLADILDDVIHAANGKMPVEEHRDERLTLRLGDLMEDSNGEIVLFNDSHVPHLAVATDVATIARGEAGHHVTASGEDVTGFHYIAFGNGLRLYYQDGLDLVIVDEGQGIV